MKFTMFCSRDDVVLLPIPFTDLSSSKVRPAVMVGHGSWPGDLLVVPVTSQLQNADLIICEKVRPFLINFARRRAYDWRAALLLIQQGVTEFATVNEKDFRDCGFKRVWNPLAAD